MSSTSVPRMFVSYSWSSPEHEAWVLNLAKDLRSSGVDVIIDKWDLGVGHDANAFMEQMVTDETITKVILICDKIYAEKTNNRTGGAGTEAQIISPEIYNNTKQSKFAAVLAELDAERKPYLPAYYKSRIYIDLSDGARFTDEYEKLLHWAFDKPVYVKPELGRPPAFLSDGQVLTLGTESRARKAADAIRDDRPNWTGFVADYFSTFAENLERFRVEKWEGNRVDNLLENISHFILCRNEAVEIFRLLSRYQPNEESAKLLHGFFESLLPFSDRPEATTSWSDTDWDNFRFISLELFLYCISVLLNAEQFKIAKTLLDKEYFVPSQEYRITDGMVRFVEFGKEIRIIDRNFQVKLIEQRANTSGIPMTSLHQADFVLFIRDRLDCIADKNKWQTWLPITNFRGRYSPFEIFAKAKSKKYAAQIYSLMGVANKSSFDQLRIAFENQQIHNPFRMWMNPTQLMAIDKMETTP